MTYKEAKEQGYEPPALIGLDGRELKMDKDFKREGNGDPYAIHWLSMSDVVRKFYRVEG